MSPGDLTAAGRHDGAKKDALVFRAAPLSLLLARIGGRQEVIE